MTDIEQPGGPAGDRRPSGDCGQAAAELVSSHILGIPDYPKPGILFWDLSPLFADGDALAGMAKAIVAACGEDSFDVVAGIEARGFMVATAVALVAGKGVVPIRKAGKLPRQTLSASYELEYGEATIEVHADAFHPRQRVLVVDDVLATGGTAQAALTLVERAGGQPVGLFAVLELAALGGRTKLSSTQGSAPVNALLIV